MKINITGRPIVKKNRMQIVYAGGRPRPIPSKAYKRFENDAIPQIIEQTLGKKFRGSIELDVKFYIKGKYHVDLDNLISSICDVLQASGTIVDDDLITAITATKVGNCSDWLTEIGIRDFD